MTFSDCKVCVFDAYGTLFGTNAIIGRAEGALGQRAEAFMLAWRRRQLELSWLPLWPGAKADFWRVTSEALERVLTEYELGGDIALARRLMEGWLTPPVLPEAPGMLAAIKARGMPVAILSNGAVRMLESAVSAAGLGGLLDAVLSAQSVNRFKPDAMVYRMAMVHFDCAPEDICYVSGNAWDVSAAAVHGMRVVWICPDPPPRAKWPAGTGAVVSSLAELPALVGG